VKVLPPSFATDPDRLRRFEQEARAAGARKDSHMLNPFTLAHRSDLDSSRFGSAPAFAEEQPPDWSKIQLKATKVAGSVYMIDMVEGSGGFAGGNVGVSVGSDGIVLVDAMFAPLAPKILAVLKTLSDKPVRFVINTHVHRDHTDGNVAFGATASIVAHANTRQQLSGQGPDPEDKPAPAAALPIITVNDRLTLHQNGEDIRVFHLPHAHSDTDVVVYFQPIERSAHGGHVFLGDVSIYWPRR
jgi:glyoxylase-like metal-dependent hydrolase (beta-lactamase superfamily II)